MNLTASLKRTPKWAWYTTAGVGVAGGAIMLWNNRAAAAADTVAGDGTGDPTATDAFPGIPTNTPVITPPVIVNPGGDTEPGIGQAVDLYMGGIQDLISGFAGLNSNIMGRDASITDYMVGNSSQAWGALTELAIAGGPPKPAAQAPSPVNAKTKTMAQEAKRLKLHGKGGGYWADGKGKYYLWNGHAMARVPPTMAWEADRLNLHGIGNGYFKGKTNCYKWTGGTMRRAKCPRVATKKK